MAILNWRDHPRLRFVDFPPPFLTKGSVFIASDGGDTAWISDGTTYLQLYPDAGTGIREYTWAARPAPGSPGRVIRVSDVGPAPGIEMVDDGTRWRPRGGRQVLAMRANNPVTTQDLGLSKAEVIGPFPGGLVRTGMQLQFRNALRNSALSTSARINRVWIGPSGASTIDNQCAYTSYNTASSNSNGELLTRLDVQGDGLTTHLACPPSGAGVLLSDGYTTAASAFTPTIDFSSSWEVAIVHTSVAENTINISSATWAGGIATFNTSAAHTLAVEDKTVIASVTPSGWNIPDGAIVLSVPTTTQFTVALAANPGAYTSGGTSSRISNMISQSYVLELVG